MSFGSSLVVQPFLGLAVYLSMICILSQAHVLPVDYVHTMQGEYIWHHTYNNHKKQDYMNYLYNPVVSINGLCMSFIFMNYASQLQVLLSHKWLFNSIFIASCITIHEMLERSKAVAVAMCFCCLWNIIFAIGACPYACMYVHPSNLEESYLHYMHAWLPYFL